MSETGHKEKNEELIRRLESFVRYAEMQMAIIVDREGKVHVYQDGVELRFTKVEFVYCRSGYPTLTVEKSYHGATK